MKRRYTGEGKSGEGSFFALSLLGCPLCFSSIPWKRLMVFFWEAGGSPPLYRLSGSRPFGLLSFPRLPSSSLFRLHSITRVTPPLLPLSLHQNSTSTRNDCIVDVDTNNVSGTVDKTALLFLLSARSSFPFDSLGQGSRVAQRGQESAGRKSERAFAKRIVRGE